MTTPHTRDHAIADVAQRQHGLITIAQLHDLQFSNAAITHRVQVGRLHRIHRGVYAVGHESLSRDACWMAAVLAAGDGAALSHVAAAAHWRMWKRGGAIETTVVAPRRVVGLVGVRVFVKRNLTRRDIRRRFDIPVTTVERTIVDLGDLLTPWQLANVIHEAEFRLHFSAWRMERLLERNRGRRAVTIVRRALDVRATGSWGTLSDLEDQFLERARARGLDPLVNCEVEVVDGFVRPDFCWPEAKIAIEVDGGAHGRVRSRREDLGRAARLREAGYHLLRCGGADMEACLDRVEELLRAAGHLE